MKLKLQQDSLYLQNTLFCQIFGNTTAILFATVQHFYDQKGVALLKLCEVNKLPFELSDEVKSANVPLIEV